ncbi:hypothetical protein ACW7BJ_16170 [Azospirillum argentinense]
MSDTLEAPKTAIAVVDVTSLVPTKVFAPGGVDEILTKLEAEARATAATLDVSTPKGRKEIASLAYKVARSKTALDDMGKDLVADIKTKAALIDADRRVVRDRLDRLRDDVRKPLDDFEAAEEERVQRHEEAIADIQAMPLFSGDRATDDIADRLAKAQAIDTSGFQEFTARAEAAKAAAIATLTAALENSRARDAERAELELLRQEAAERAAREEVERIEREKQEAADRAAEQARRDAEEKARQEREEAERAAAAERERIEREAQAERDRAAAEQARVEREKAKAEERAAKAEQDRQDAERRAKEAEERAEAERIAGHERALKSIQGMIDDACSPFNGSGMIREITRIMDGMAEMARDWEEFSERAAAVIADGRARIAGRLAEVERHEEKRAEEERKAAEERARQREEEAAQRERQRIEDERKAEEETQRRREADRAHRGSINRAAMQALVAAGLSQGAARTAVEAIAKGDVPNVRISY